MKSLLERCLKRIEKTESCWLWTGLIQRGYSKISVTSKDVRYGHRVMYELLVGPIPSHLQLDHLCKVKHCVNPKHLEPVTAKVNVHRSNSPPARNSRKKECLKGHIFDELNTYRYGNKRACKECAKEGAKKRWRARKLPA